MTEDLSSAAERGDLNACSLLLRQGAGVNDVDSSGNTFKRILQNTVHTLDWICCKLNLEFNQLNSHEST
jgi:hypothetical protein